MVKKIFASYGMMTAVMVALLGGGASVNAFSLLGPFASWQSSAIGYDLNIAGVETGGPMAAGEEYRVNIPVVTYAYDATFLNYFGNKGVAALEEAFAILNSVPSADSINLAAYPLQAKGPKNFTAAGLNLLDIKSFTLGIMLGQLGVGNPERYTWCLRDRTTLPGGQINYLVIQRNLDPVFHTPTNAVNGTIYTYTVFDPITINNTTYADAVERPVDPLADDFTTLAGIENPDPMRSFGLSSGEYFTGLTRDDAAALKYIYRSSNYNIEDVIGGINLSTNPVNRSPFTPIGLTNTFQTNTLTGLALRPGIGHVQFQRIHFDSIVGTTLSYTNDYVDRFITNNVIDSQRLERVLTVPDITIVADDLGTLQFSAPLFATRSVASASWIDHSADNTIAATGLAGPGVAVPNVLLGFNKLVPGRLNQSPFFLDENQSFSGNLTYGHYDANNIFAIFPDGTSVQEIEAQIGTSPIGTGVSPF